MEHVSLSSRLTSKKPKIRSSALKELSSALSRPKEFKTNSQELKTILSALNALLKSDENPGQYHKLYVNFLNFLIQFGLVELLSFKLVKSNLQLAVLDGSTYIPLAKCVLLCASHSRVRLNLSEGECGVLLDILIEYFLPAWTSGQKENCLYNGSMLSLEEGSRQSKDQRPQSFELGLSFCYLLVDCSETLLLKNARKYLWFISDYINSYDYENQINEYLLVTAVRILLALDVNDLDLTAKFLESVLKKCWQSFSYNPESHQRVLINLTRLYFNVCSHYSYFKDEDPGRFRTVQRIWSLASDCVDELLRGKISPLTMSIFEIDSDSEFNIRVLDEKSEFSFMCLHLCSDLTRFSIACFDGESQEHVIEYTEESGSKQSEEENYSSKRKRSSEPRNTKRKRQRTVEKFIDNLVHSGDASVVLFGLQVLLVTNIRFPEMGQTLYKQYQNLFTTHFNSNCLSTRECVRLILLLFVQDSQEIPSGLDPENLWDMILFSISDDQNLGVGSLKLLNVIMNKRLVKSQRVLKLVALLKVHKLDQVHLCLYGIMNFGSFWSPKDLNDVLRLNFPLVDIQTASNEKCIAFINSINALFKQRPIERRPNYEMFSEAQLFEEKLASLLKRLYLVSGFNGAKLVDLVLKKKEIDASIVPEKDLNEMILQLILEWIESWDIYAEGSFKFAVTICSLTHTVKHFGDVLKSCSKATTKLQLIMETCAQKVDPARLRLMYELNHLPSYLSNTNVFAYIIEQNLKDIVNQLNRQQKPTSSSNGSRPSLLQDAFLGQSVGRDENLALTNRVVDFSVVCQYYSTIKVGREHQEAIISLVEQLLEENSSIHFQEVELYWESLVMMVESSNFLLIPETMLKFLKYFISNLSGSRLRNNKFAWSCLISLLSMLFLKRADLFKLNFEFRGVIETINNSMEKSSSWFPSDLKIKALRLTLQMHSIDDSIIKIENSPLEAIIHSLLSIRMVEIELVVARDFIRVYTQSFVDLGLLPCFYAQPDQLEAVYISTAMIYSSVFLASVKSRKEMVLKLYEIASLNDSLDTVECVFHYLYQDLKYSSVEQFNQVFVEYSIFNWPREWNSFPYFLLEKESLQDFIVEFLGPFTSCLIKNLNEVGLTELLQTLGKDLVLSRAFPRLYCDYFKLEGTEEQKKLILGCFGLNELDIVKLARKEIEPILFNLLERMTGLDKTDAALETNFAATLCMVNQAPVSKEKSNALVVIKAIEELLTCPISQIGKKLSIHSVYKILKQFAEYFILHKWSTESLNVLANGYLTFALCCSNRYDNGLLFQLCFCTLMECSYTSFGASMAIPVAHYLVQNAVESSILADNVVGYTYLLNMLWLYFQHDKGTQGILQKLCTAVVQKLRNSDKHSYLKAAYCFDNRIDVPFDRQDVRFTHLLEICDSVRSLELASFEEPFQKLENDLEFYSTTFLESELSALSDSLCRLSATSHLEKKQYFYIRSCILKLNCSALITGTSDNINNEYKEAYDITTFQTFHYVVLMELFPFLANPSVEVVLLAVETISALLKSTHKELIANFPEKIMNQIDFLTSSKIKLSESNKNLAADIENVGEDFVTSFVLEVIGKFNICNDFQCLRGIILKFPSFATHILTHLVYYILSSNGQNARSIMEMIMSILKREQSSKAYQTKHFLDCFKFINTFPDICKNLLIEYQEIIEKALEMSDYTLSLYYMEYLHLKGDSDSNKAYWANLLNTYKGLEDEDGFIGTIESLDTSHFELVDLIKQKYEHDKNWIELWSLEDSQLQSFPKQSDKTFSTCLAQSGHYYTLGKVFNEENLDGSGNEEAIECLWRLGRWDAIPTLEDDSENLQVKLYQVLYKWENSKNYDALKVFVVDALSTGQKFGQISLEVGFKEIEEAIMISDCDSAAKTFETWDKRLDKLEASYPFNELERLLAIRTKLYTKMIKNTDTADKRVEIVQNYYSKHLLRVVENALANNEFNLARKSIIQHKQVFGRISADSTAQLDVYSAQAEWGKGEKTIAMHYLSSLLGQNANISPSLKTFMQNLYGNWSIESKNLHPTDIIESYLQPATDPKDSFDLGKAHFDLAKFCDSLLEETQNDETYSRAMETLTKRNLELVEVQKSNSFTKKERYIYRIQRQMEIEQEIIDKITLERNNYIENSITNYLKTLAFSEFKTDHSLFRFLSLWFANCTNEKLNSIVVENLSTVPLKKFIPLMHQLTARMAAQDPSDSVFYAALNDLIFQITLEYPFHTLGHIIMLKNVSKDKRGLATISAKSISEFLQRIKSVRALHHIAYQMDLLYAGYIAVAYQPLPKDTPARGYHLDSSCGLLKLDRDFKLPVLTVNQKLPNPKDYSIEVSIVKFETQYSVPGGINAPKVIKCHGSDGKIYKQLVKGNDDLRQDSVISSVFSIMNKLLSSTKVTVMRKLNIRTYKIVPVAGQAGVVHWIDGAAPLGEVLTQEYTILKPKWSMSKCRQKMKAEHDKKASTIQSKLKVFNEIEEHLPVVFGNTLFSLYRDPSHWYESRRRYITSCVTCCMAGHVLGIGDRHSQNLLFDKITGELIHIDLGIAFDQGKLLSTPELVPFRLTRNLVHAMGITGYRGVFKRGCEEALRVFCNESAILFTLLDVLRYDPLHTWTISPLKLKRVQQSNEESEPGQVRGNEEADEAIFGIRRKLCLQTSVECTVQELINRAIDRNNLCRMYPGWQPWL